jgi:glycosyltransferase involved in cell wall biosynthesis
MKVVICKGQTMGPISGADETLVTYATHLRRAGVSVSVLLMFPRPGDSYYERLAGAGVPVCGVARGAAVRAMRAGRRFAARLLSAAPRTRTIVRGGGRRVSGRVASRYFLRCRELLARERPDLIHVVTPDPASVVFIRAGHSLGIPVLYQELGIPFHPPGYEDYYRHFTSALPLCTQVAALSPALAARCQETLPTDGPVCVLPIMADDPRPPRASRRAAGDRVAFGFAARFEAIKGVAELMEAFGLARGRAPGVELCVAGAGSKAGEMSERAAALGAGAGFRHAGVYEDPEGRARFLRGIDVLVLPSHTEGTPNSIAEAMAQGLPVVASAVGGIPDMLGEDAGLLVRAGDAAALADAMVRLARDAGLRERMGRAARARYERLYSPQAVLPLLLQTYDELSAARRPAALAPPPASAAAA